MLSAFFRTCLSVTLEVPAPTADCALDIGPGWPAAPIIADIVSASLAVFSNASYTSVLNKDFDFASAFLRFGFASLCGIVIDSVSRGDTVLPTRPLFGEVELVVTVVVAVLGLSFEEFDRVAAEVGGIFPITSTLLMRCLRSSNSSQIVDCAVVDVVDSVSSVPARGISTSSLGSIVFETRGEEL